MGERHTWHRAGVVLLLICAAATLRGRTPAVDHVFIGEGFYCSVFLATGGTDHASYVLRLLHYHYKFDRPNYEFQRNDMLSVSPRVR